MSKNKKEGSQGKRASSSGEDLPQSVGFLVRCDPPIKQYIQHLNELASADRKFIIEDLDARHLLIKHKNKDEVMRKVATFQDNNVFSAVEKVGEDLDTS